MGSYVRKLEQHAQQVLEPSEQLLAASRALPKGATAAIAASVAGSQLGAAGMVAASKVGEDQAAEGKEQVTGAGFSYAQQMVLALTDRRLLAWSRGSATNRPKDFLGAIALDQIAEMRGKKGLFKHELHVELTSGATMDFVIVRVDGVGELVEHFTRLRGASQPQ